MTIRTITDAKARAKSLRQALCDQGTPISHAEALERIAHDAGARDWNTLHARLAGGQMDMMRLHDQIEGQYLGQEITGKVVALTKSGRRYNIALQLDQPVDTVVFDSFSNMRRHIRGVVDEDGRSKACTSDETPHLVVRKATRRFVRKPD